MKSKKLIIIVISVIFLIILSNFIFSQVLKNPLVSGEKFGPLVLGVSRLIPREISTIESTSFQGLTTPRSSPDQMLVYDISELSHEDELKARVFQGLLNREKPILYLIGSEKDEFWLEQISAEKTVVSDLDYSNYPTIKYDVDSVKQKYLAITLSGVYDAIPVTSAEDPIYDLTILSEEEINMLVLEVSKETNKNMISFRDGKIDHIDFIVKNKMIMSSLALSGEDSPMPVYHKSTTEAEISDEIMSQMNPDCAMVGYNINPGIIGEVETIGYLSEKGCFSLPIPGVPNLSFLSALERAKPTHSTPISNITLEDKVYVVIILSDGDNLDLPYSKYKSFSQQHETPLAWSVSPFLNEFAPNMFEYYSSNLPQGDTLVVAPSGGGFIYPSTYKYFPAFVEHTDKFMKESDLKYIWLLDIAFRGYSPEMLDEFSQISNGLFMEYTILQPYSKSIEFYNDNPAVWSAAFVEKDGNIAERIVERTPKERPAFLFIGTEMRYNFPKHIDSEIAQLSDDYEVVSVPEFIDLIKQSRIL